MIPRRLVPLTLAAVVGAGTLGACRPVPLPEASIRPPADAAVATTVPATVDEATSETTSEGDGTAAETREAKIRAAVVELARDQIGTPYRSGGMTPGKAFDCSGLTTWAWKQAGVTLPRTSATQYAGTERIKVDELLPGDLVFYSSAGPRGRVTHVSLYAGEGKIVHARRPGVPLREDSLATYWTKNLVGYGRVEVPADALLPDVPVDDEVTASTTTVAPSVTTTTVQRYDLTGNPM